MPQQYLTIEISAAKIRYAVVAAQIKDLHIQKIGETPYSLNVQVPGGLTQKLRELIADEGITPQRIFVSVSRFEVLVRHMRMPRMKAQEMDEAIIAEIEKVPIFAAKLGFFSFTSSGGYSPSLTRQHIRPIPKK